jgi:hypothetical protein
MNKPVEPVSCREKDWQEYAQAISLYSTWLATQPTTETAPAPVEAPAPAEPPAVEAAPVAHPTPPAPVYDPATGEWKLS